MTPTCLNEVYVARESLTWVQSSENSECKWRNRCNPAADPQKASDSEAWSPTQRVFIKTRDCRCGYCSALRRIAAEAEGSSTFRSAGRGAL